MNKYSFTGTYILLNGATLYQICALRDFGDVKKGDLGGFLQSGENLSQTGRCWVDQNAKVYQFARVLENARITGRAKVYGSSRVLGNAVVSDEAHVFGRAVVSAKAEVVDQAQVFGEVHLIGSVKVRGRAVVTEGFFDKGDFTANQLTVKEYNKEMMAKMSTT